MGLGRERRGAGRSPTPLIYTRPARQTKGGGPRRSEEISMLVRNGALVRIASVARMLNDFGYATR